VVLGFVTGYIILSHGRAALLGLVVAVLTYLIFSRGWLPRRAVTISALLLGVAIASSGAAFWRGGDTGDSLTRVIDTVTSGRSILWRHAIATPPSHVLTGIGVNNLRSSGLSILNFRAGPAQKEVKVAHLHNFAMDAWYETGLLGLTALLVWLAALYRYAFLAWYRASGLLRSQLGVLLAAALAVTFSALFSFSYGSRQFALSMYLFLMSAASFAPRSASSVVARD
jgi:O-antigen ligase